MQIITSSHFSRTAQNDQMDRYLCCCYVLQSSLRQASMLTRSAYIHLSINRRQPFVKLPSIRRVNARDAPFQLNCTKNLGGSFSQPPPFSSAMQNFGELQDQDEPVNQLDESSGQVAQTSLGTRPLFEDKPTSKVQIVCAASYVLESLLVQELILARSTSN